MQRDLRSEILRDAVMFTRHWNAIRELQWNVSARADVLLDPVHFLTATDDKRRSCSVAIWRGERLIGLMYATQHYIKRVATGYAVGGDYSGRGLLLCSAPDESAVLRESIWRLASGGVHSMHLRLLPREDWIAPDQRLKIKGLRIKFLDAEIPGDVLRLDSDYEGFLGGLGKHTRRNIRACMRKTAREGIEFMPVLSKFEYDRAAERLNAETDFPADALRLARDERLLELHDGERLGLRAADGVIVAVLCGFRKGGGFHLLTQLNDANYKQLSLSLVLRGYMTQYLIQNGLTYLHFMGGSSLTFGRYCQPERYRSIFVDRKFGLAAAAKVLVSRVVILMRRMRTSIPELLVVLCNGHLDDALLTERTVLRPAAMLKSQRTSA